MSAHLSPYWLLCSAEPVGLWMSAPSPRPPVAGAGWRVSFPAEAAPQPAPPRRPQPGLGAKQRRLSCRQGPWCLRARPPGPGTPRTPGAASSPLPGRLARRGLSRPDRRCRSCWREPCQSRLAPLRRGKVVYAWGRLGRRNPPVESELREGRNGLLPFANLHVHGVW